MGTAHHSCVHALTIIPNCAQCLCLRAYLNFHPGSNFALGRAAATADSGSRGLRKSKSQTSSDMPLSSQFDVEKALDYLKSRFEEADKSSKKLYLEVFSGSGRVAKYIETMGHICIQIDIRYVMPVDVTNRAIADVIVHHIMLKRVSGVWLGTPCSSWSLARRGRAGRPGGPLRTIGEFIWGHPDALARPKDRRKIFQGNRLARISYRIIYACHLHGTPWAIENPGSSRIWKTPLFKQIKAWKDVDVRLTHMCAHGEAYKKPTRIMSAFCQSGFLIQKCACTHEHEALVGEALARAQEYSVEFAAAAACMLLS